jgi:hypothetical protein
MRDCLFWLWLTVTPPQTRALGGMRDCLLWLWLTVTPPHASTDSCIRGNAWLSSLTLVHHHAFTDSAPSDSSHCLSSTGGWDDISSSGQPLISSMISDMMVPPAVVSHRLQCPYALSSSLFRTALPPHHKICCAMGRTMTYRRIESLVSKSK